MVIGLDFKLNEINLTLLLFASFYALSANVDYWVRIIKKRSLHIGMTMAHIGFINYYWSYNF